MKRFAHWGVIDFKMYGNHARKTMMVEHDDPYRQRTELRGLNANDPVASHLRLVYDRARLEKMPDEFQELLDRLD